VPGEAILSAENSENLRAVEAPPRTPLGELTGPLAGRRRLAAPSPRIPYLLSAIILDYRPFDLGPQ